MGRKCQIQKNRMNSHSKFSQTVTSKQWRSRKLSETVAGTSADNAGSNARTHTIQTICRQCTDEMDCPTRSVAHFLVFRGSEIQSPFYRAIGDRIVEIGGVWSNSSCASSRGRKKDLEIQHQNLADRWKSGVWLRRATSQTNTLFEQMME